MRTYTLIAAALALAGSGLAVWRMQKGTPSSAGPPTSGQRNARPRHASNVPPPKWMTDQMEAEAKPSNDATRHARALLAAGDLAGAEAECRRAVALLSAIHGAPANGMAVRLLGEICLRQGKNREALQCFLRELPYAVGGDLNLQVVIAYCRLGEYQNAKKYYSDAVLQQLHPGKSPLDFPGSRDLASLEASALLACGIDMLGPRRLNEALEDFLAAERLAPKNPLIAWRTARVLSELRKWQEALPRYRIAATYGHEPIQSEAKIHVLRLESWFREHPDAAPNKSD